MRRPPMRLTIRRVMAVVALIAVTLTVGKWVAREVARPRNPRGGRSYQGSYKLPDGRIIRGAVIYVRDDGIILVD